MKAISATPFNLNNSGLVAAFDELPLWSAPFGLKIMEYIDYRKKINVLDIGCGTGFPIIEIALRLGSTCKITAIDPWKAALQRAKNKCKQYYAENIEFVEGIAEELPFKDNSIDLIVSNNGINNVQDLPKVLKECSRVARPDAQILFSVNMKRTMKEFYDVFRKVLENEGLDHCVCKMKAHIEEKRKSVIDLTEEMQRNNLNIKQVIKEEFKYQFADGTAFLNHYFIRLAFMPEWLKVVDGNNADMVFTKIENELNQLAAHNGKLVLTIPYVVIEARKE